MSKAKIHLDAMEKLEFDFAHGVTSFIEYAMRRASLIKLADTERRPVADKALALWLASGTPHLKGWLREQAADVILQAAGPVKRGPEINVYIGPFAVGEALSAVELDVFFPCGLCFTGSEYVRSYPLREECADAVAFSWGIRTRSIEDFQRITRERSAERLINDCGNDLEEFNAKRQPVADAALWLWLRGVFNNLQNYFMRDGSSAGEIMSLAESELSIFNARRQPIADAAQILFTVFGRKADSFISGGLDPVGKLNILDIEREEFADAAQAFWLIAPAPDAGITMTRSLEQLVSDARYWYDLRVVDCMRDAIAISNGLSRPKASELVRKIAALILEEVATNEAR